LIRTQEKKSKAKNIKKRICREKKRYFCADLGTFYIKIVGRRRSAKKQQEKTEKKAGEGLFSSTLEPFFADLYKGSYKL